MLDTRLQMIYEMMPQTERMCDIGTDHGKLPVYCVKTGKAKSALACDLRRGPLSSCKALLEREGLCDRIDTLLSDGFLSIPAPDFESIGCFVLAGMGGELIQKILTDRPCRAYMILQPQSAVCELVTYLLQNGYEIFERRYCADGDKLYTAMLVKYDGTQRTPDLFCKSVRNDAFYRYLENELKKCDISLRGLMSARVKDNARIECMQNLKTIIEGELKK